MKDQSNFHKTVRNLMLLDPESLLLIDSGVKLLLARQGMVKKAEEKKGKRREELFANLFGYLFAKAAEMQYAQNCPRSWFKKKLICSYTPSDAWAGEIRSDLSSAQHIQLQDAFALGKQFFRDFKFFQERAEESSRDENLQKSLMLTQNLGCFYSKKCLDW